MPSPRRHAARCLVLLFVVVSATGAHAAATVASTLTARFAAMNGRGWTGGDASWSARLPDGRTAWLFGDTFVGGVDHGGRRDPRSLMVHNSLIVEGRTWMMRTLVGGSAARPASLVPGRTRDDWYWPGPPVVGHATLQVPMAHIARTGRGAWDFRVDGTSLAVFTLPALTLRRVSPLVTPTNTNMASAAVTSGRFTYVYGTRDAWPYGKDAFVARTRAGDLSGRWSYWTGRRWSRRPGKAAPIARGVSDQFSVLRRGSRWLLITQVPLSSEIDAFSARAPQGPWRRLGRIARIPEIAHAFTYNATVHPEYSRGRTLVLGYNVNGDDIGAVFADACLYRPRFMTVRLPA
jgi:Domain of unknown function (DUF4185)